ncbi:sodium:solute symporter [Glaciecola siphonariae]|uniref:Sodium:solute symporter n=1 Tax=Glaciecola siphonariae TaxID=521012 RepID=A0ABV9M0E5_9ALTE
MGTIHNIDLYIIAAYFLVVLAIGVWVGLKTKTGEDLFLGGRTLTWGVIGASLFASNISSTTLIGLTGAAYTTGIASSNYEWLAGVPLIIMAAVFIPIYLRAQITTVPEYLEMRYDVRSRKIFSSVTIVTSVLVDMAGGLYAGAIVLQVFFPELSLTYTAIGLALVAGFYTAFGGLKAVAYTDTLQAIILVVGCSILTYMLFDRLDFSWSMLTSSVPDNHLSVVRPMDDPTLPWLGTLVGVPLLGFWYWVTNQYVTQRVLAAKNVQHARWGAMLGGFLKILPLFIMVLPGAMAISILPNIENGDMVFPTLVAEVLPVGVVGIVLAGLVSAIMSTVDSTLNSASTLVVVDFVKPRRPGISDREVAKIGRICTIVIMLIAALWAPQIANFGGLWTYLQQMFAIIVPPVAVLFLVGVFYRTATPTAAFWTLILGFVLGIAMFLARQSGLLDMHFSVGVGVMFAVCTAIFVAVSKFGPQDLKQDVSALVFDKSLIAEKSGTSIFADYRVHAVLLVISMLWVLVTFW